MKPQAFNLTRIRNAMNLPVAKGIGKALIGFGVLAVALSVVANTTTNLSATDKRSCLKFTYVVLSTVCL